MILAYRRWKHQHYYRRDRRKKNVFCRTHHDHHRKTESGICRGAEKVFLKFTILPQISLMVPIVSSVVPPLNRTILAAIRKITGLNAMLVGSGMKTGLNILMDNPKSVGSDMIVNAVGALAEHEPPIIIIEMGTATTMSVIDKNGRYVGGAILPGLRVSLDSMSASTAQLPRISLDTPRRVIGKNTIDCMRSGVIFGNAAMIDGMLDRIEEELGEKTSIIATGGISKIVLPLCSHTITYDGALLMKGLLHLYEKNRRTE